MGYGLRVIRIFVNRKVRFGQLVARPFLNTIPPAIRNWELVI